MYQYKQVKYFQNYWPESLESKTFKSETSTPHVVMSGCTIVWNIFKTRWGIKEIYGEDKGK